MRIDNKAQADTIMAATNARRQMNVESSVSASCELCVSVFIERRNGQNESHSQRDELTKTEHYFLNGDGRLELGLGLEEGELA